LKLLYRADGSPEIGTGHLLRGLRIAAALCVRGSHTLHFCVRAHPWAVERLRGAGVPVSLLPLDLSPTGEVERCLRAARENGCDAAAIDLLDTPAEPDLSGALRAAGLRVTTFDDTGPGRLSANQVINFLVREPDPAALSARRVRLYEGPEYATLAPEYAGRNRRLKTIQPMARNLLITMGGGDAAGLSVKCLSALNPQPSLSVTVVVGSAFPHLESLRQAAERSPHQVRIETAAPTLLPEWEAADLALIAGGLTIHEALGMGVPGLALCQDVWHQRFLANLFEGQGMMVDLGLGSEVEGPAVAAAVSDFIADAPRREWMSRAGQQLCDGRGTERVASLLLD
jgi:UDP-2,4-diacetamido-2,4,6-trideoxy-beta-L-altropyranose hydrolase